VTLAERLDRRAALVGASPQDRDAARSITPPADLGVEEPPNPQSIAAAPRVELGGPSGTAPGRELAGRLLERRIEGLRTGERPWAQPEPVASQVAPIAAPLAADDPTSRLRALRKAVDLDSSLAPHEAETQVGRLAALLPLGERATAFGPCCVVERTYASDARHGERGLADVLGRELGAGLVNGEGGFEAFDAGRALFLDLETTGLAHGMGTLAFLIGTAHFHGPRLVLEQWLLREPDDEPAMLADFARRCLEVDYLVTFNGRSFDLPLLRTRFAANRMDDPTTGLVGHLDLLHASRRLLGAGLPNCRLATLEQARLGVRRVEDAPGSEAPARYNAYLHGDDPAPLVEIVAHNRDDVLSMVTLLDLLLERRDRASANAWSDPECALALAKHATALGEWTYAEDVYTALADLPASARAGRRGLARLSRRRARVARMEKGSPGVIPTRPLSEMEDTTCP